MSRPTGRGLVLALALALLPVALMIWSFGHWADPQIDFGREVYAAWRVAEGDRPYVDLAWFNGPLSVTWNALWMRVAGVSLHTLAWVNLGVVYATLALLWVLVRRWAGGVAAGASVSTFLGVFAFGQYAGVGNYNFIAPYSHGIVHGAVLGLGALAALQRLGRTGRLGWAGLAGLLLGLAFLTKAEVFLAGAVAGCVRLALHAAQPGKDRGRAWPAFVGAGLVPPAVAFLLLNRSMPAELAWRSTLGSWAYAGDPRLRELLYYRRMSGLDRPPENLAVLAGAGAALIAAAALLRWLGARLSRGADEDLLARGAAWVAGAGTCALVMGLFRWKVLVRGYPLALLVIGVLVARRWWRGRDAAAADQLAFVVLAGVLLAKLALNVTIEHYGFVLALPATVVLVVAAVDAVPRAVARAGGAGRVTRAVALGALTVFVAARLRSSNEWYSNEPHRLRGHAEVVRAGWRGPALRATLADLDERLEPDDTLLVLPEGVMLNFLLRRRSPTRYLNFMPPELIFWGERPVVEALREDPPEAVCVVHKETRSDYGKPWFGSPGFGEELMEWLRAGYERVETYGHTPLRDPFEFGVEVWLRR